MMKKLSRSKLEVELGRPLTRLERAALRWLNSSGEGYEGSGWRGAYRDLERGGCQSGMVSGLIYYRDTMKFYRKYEQEIDALLSEMMADMGAKGPGELFGEKWDSDDPLGKGDLNRNLLAWFGFEEAARVVARTGGY